MVKSVRRQISKFAVAAYNLLSDILITQTEQLERMVFHSAFVSQKETLK